MPGTWKTPGIERLEVETKPSLFPCMVEPSAIWIFLGCGAGSSLENKEEWGVMWLQQAESKSQVWDLPGRTERVVERDALPAIRIAWAMISCRSVGKRLIVDPKDWDLAEMEAIGGVGSILAITAVDCCDDNKFQWCGQDACNSCRTFCWSTCDDC